MTKEELNKLKQTIDYFGHWYDVIGEERISILEKSIEYIAELEKENAELKKRIEWLDMAIDCDIPVADKIAELENENAELKEKLKPENCLKLLAKEGYIKFTSDQLTKAKEIIEELYNIIPASMADYAKEPMEHARKFMTEEVSE